MRFTKWYPHFDARCIVFVFWYIVYYKGTANKEENLFHSSKLTFERVIAVYIGNGIKGRGIRIECGRNLRSCNQIKCYEIPPPRWRPRYRCAEKRETPDLSCICLSQWSPLLPSVPPLSRLIGKATLWQTRELKGERVFSREITILPWYRLTISLLRILYLSEGGRNSRVSSRRDKGIQESTVVSLMCFVSKIRSEEEKRNGGKGKISKERDFINDTMGQRNVYFLRIRDRNRNRARF